MFHIVDDTLLTCDLIEEVIRRHGYRTLSFTSPEGYLDYVHSIHFKTPIATFVDVLMPIMSGYELMHEVQKIAPRSKFVVMTGEPGVQSEHIDKACMYLGKPMTPFDIIKVIDCLIRCQAFDPHEEHRCRCSDHRQLFETDDWRCPQKHLLLN